MSILGYLFDPFPSAAAYSDVQLLPFVILSVGLLIASFFLSRWSRGNPNPITKKLSKSWPTVSFVFGFVGLILCVSRAESIQYISMRFLWVVWGLLGILYIVFQYRVFQSRHYEILPGTSVRDPRADYLPKRKKK